jgi:hypothetical protein
MECLPYIDEHRIRIGATPDAVWEALVSVLRTQGGAVPLPLARAWGLTPGERRGDWSAPLRAGDSVPGFEVADVQRARRLALRGQHRFSRYALVFELEPTDTDGCTLRAQSWAAFPGVAGAAYRVLVIGTRGHRLAVRRLLRSVARRA